MTYQHKKQNIAFVWISVKVRKQPKSGLNEALHNERKYFPEKATKYFC